jgi:hypothetical protein
MIPGVWCIPSITHIAKQKLSFSIFVWKWFFGLGLISAFLRRISFDVDLMGNIKGILLLIQA